MKARRILWTLMCGLLAIGSQTAAQELGAGRGVDHVGPLVRPENFDAAASVLTDQLGFSLTPTLLSPLGAKNRLIWFSDLTYLEVVTFTDLNEFTAPFVAFLEDHEGAKFYGADVIDAAQAITFLNGAGYPNVGPLPAAPLTIESTGDLVGLTPLWSSIILTARVAPDNSTFFLDYDEAQVQQMFTDFPALAPRPETKKRNAPAAMATPITMPMMVLVMVRYSRSAAANTRPLYTTLDTCGAVRVGAVSLLLLFFHGFHRAAAWFARADEHGVVTAFGADVFHFLVLSRAVAGADDRDVTAAIGTRVLLTNGHHLDMCVVSGHLVDHHVLALAANHRDRVPGLQGFRRSLGLDLVHVQRMLLVLFVRCCLGRNGPRRKRHGDRESETEEANSVIVGFRFHNCVLHVQVMIRWFSASTSRMCLLSSLSFHSSVWLGRLIRRR